MSNLIAVGVDRGFGATKYSSKTVEGYIDSLVAPISKTRAKELMENNAMDKKLIILKDVKDGAERYFLIGSYVSNVETRYAERDLRRGRDNEIESILFKAGLGLAVPSSDGPTEVIVTTGLPTSDYEVMRDAYIRDIENNQEPYVFSIFKGNVEHKKNIIVKRANVENQPKGTMLTIINEKLIRKENWTKIKLKKYGIIDLGFNTTDLSMYIGKDLIVDENNNFSTFAMVKIINTIKKNIETKFSCKKTEADILASLTSYKVTVRGIEVDCREQVEDGFRTNAALLVREISSKWEDYLDLLDEIILTGGVVENDFFFNTLKDLFKEELNWDVSRPKNPRFANAGGFYLLSESIVQKMQ